MERIERSARNAKRLTLRTSAELDAALRSEAKAAGISLNQFILYVLCRWAKSRRSQPRIP
ncbi:MAG: toxin-antitoxin system HicB family antitoxin [Eubacteriales bacterium]|nr:toxin-antitoxin system HicB family antitoxin [Eubacteriales bacterium]